MDTKFCGRPIISDRNGRTIFEKTPGQQKLVETINSNDIIFVFNNYDFQNDTDKDWLEFVNGTLNLFYHTSEPNIEADETWFIDLMQSEVEARDIVTEQVYHGSPNLNAFWKIETNSKPEEVGGRRNGYIYVTKLADLKPADTQGYYWGVLFQCPESVSLAFDDGGTKRRKCICWAADVKHMTLVRVGSDGRLMIVPVFVETRGLQDI